MTEPNTVAARPVVAAIALGGNLGDSQRILTEAMQVIEQVEGIEGLARSPLYKTAPVGPPQPDYLNACMLVETDLSPLALLHQLLAIEYRFGRVRTPHQRRWGARSLDLDLLLYGNHTLELPGLTVPHPRLHERAFVLVPLHDIAPQWRHPHLGQTITQLLHRLRQNTAITPTEKLENQPGASFSPLKMAPYTSSRCPSKVSS